MTHDVDEAVEGADVVMALRIQLERMRSPAFPEPARVRANCTGSTGTALALAATGRDRHAPGPMNRGVEITGDVADGSRSVILEQVTNGVAVRMAVLYLLAGEIGREAAA